MGLNGCECLKNVDLGSLPPAGALKKKVRKAAGLRNTQSLLSEISKSSEVRAFLLPGSA